MNINTIDGAIYGKRLEELRELKNLTRADIAKILGIEDSVYRKYENEKKYIPIKHLNTLSNFYNVSLDYILALSNQTFYQNNHDHMNVKLSSERLKEIRKEINLTQKELADKLNTTQSMICSYEKAKNIIPIIHVYYISKKYKISADYLLGKTDHPKHLK